MGIDLGDWNGHIWGDPGENSSKEAEELEERDVCPLIKTERHMGLQSRNPQTTVCMIPWTGPELSKLQTKLSCKPGKVETEYLWTFSLMGGDQILLSHDEVGGFWSLGVFLSDGLEGDQSITSQVAYWARGLDAKEWREHFTIKGIV